MVRFANHVLHVAMHSYSRIQQHRYGSPGSIWKAVSQEMIDCDACFFHRGSFRHAWSIASMSEKAQSAVPFVCSGSDASLATPPSPVRRPEIEQGKHVLFGVFHDGRLRWATVGKVSKLAARGTGRRVLQQLCPQPAPRCSYILMTVGISMTC